MPVTYPLDPSGVSPANLVQGELHSVNESVFRDYNFILPELTPFYVDNFKASLTINGTTRELVEDVDFSFALSYVTGTRTYGKAIYGAITLHSLENNGLITLQYQTVGGETVVDRLEVLTTLADKAYNPRTTIFDILTGVPASLPPIPHYQDYDQFFGQEEVVGKLGEIRDAIITNSSLTTEQIRTFLENLNSISFTGFLLKTGDTMTGPLMLARNPTESLEAVTKQYLDSTAATKQELAVALSDYLSTTDLQIKLDNKVNVYGSTMTGPLILNADPVEDMQATNKSYVDNRITELEEEVETLRSRIGSIEAEYISKTEVGLMIDELLLRVGFIS